MAKVMRKTNNSVDSRNVYVAAVFISASEERKENRNAHFVRAKTKHRFNGRMIFPLGT